MAYFDDDNEHALRHPKIDLRNNIGVLAIEILKAKENLAVLSYDEIMRKTLDIIEELHEIYDKRL
ncbi:hypothetical protein [Phascolarctobacterium succinatutens]|jgi:hypothetical protein|uniref:hypothetical protein n=1 Tax=Phascolarctobacterium succinatutens TaxID=626940 RepID=UPI00206A50B4|nr:MAG TPA: hypothetical protein [Caudoviricetes sp.]DAW27844.1 MAG TPA: hypothetical protein [Caudoviricetes sp.]